MLGAYSFLGATALFYTEHQRDEELKHALIAERRLFAESIWNATRHYLHQQSSHPHHGGQHHHHRHAHGWACYL